MVRRITKAAPRKPSRRYRLDRDGKRTVPYRGLHKGLGSVHVKSVFGRGSNARPALIYVYRIPPAASEGMHTHARGLLQVHLVALKRR